MRRRTFLSRQHDANNSELINLTPLLDVLFVVLIMFILIAPLLDLDHIVLAPGGEKSIEFTTLNNKKPIKIFLHHDDSIWLGKYQLLPSQLPITLKELYKLHPNEIPELYPDNRASFGKYQMIKNHIEAAGFEELDVVLKKE